ncbi:hypothetical protein [Polyangium aurulentum]|uniref:hypothetical protein n=1 Tax=Polyangium aurulentum TaxID=2567896 RepID=UPI001134F5FE
MQALVKADGSRQGILTPGALRAKKAAAIPVRQIQKLAGTRSFVFPLPMGRMIQQKVLACAFAVFVASSTIPGCVIRFGPITEEEPLGSGTDTGSTPQDPEDPEPTQDEQAEAEAQAAFDEIDPQELALAHAKSSLTTAYLVAQAESSGIDPSTLDAAALEQLMQGYLPEAAAWADAWLATLDPATLPLWYYKPTCEFDEGCASRVPCKYNAPSAKHLCYVTDCGKSRCSACPDWMADLLKSLVLTSWCSYVCVELGKPAPNNVVAIGAGGISAFKGYFVGPICKDP